MKSITIMPAPAALAPPLLEPEAALVLRLREASITLPDHEARASMLANAQALANRAEGVRVRKPDDYAAAGSLLTEVKAAQKTAKAAFESIPGIKRAIEAWRDQYTTTLDGIEVALKTEMLTWKTKEDDAQRQREAKARADAEAAARAEQDRLAEEAKAAAAKAKADGDTAGARALAAEAKAIASAPVAVAPVKVESRVPKVAGLRTTHPTTGTVTDAVAILRWIVDHPEHAVDRDGFPAAISFSVSWLNRMAKSGVQIPGLLVKTESGMAAGAR